MLISVHFSAGIRDKNLKWWKRIIINTDVDDTDNIRCHGNRCCGNRCKHRSTVGCAAVKRAGLYEQPVVLLDSHALVHGYTTTICGPIVILLLVAYCFLFWVNSQYNDRSERSIKYLKTYEVCWIQRHAVTKVVLNVQLWPTTMRA